jgi:hypothetical protein
MEAFQPPISALSAILRSDQPTMAIAAAPFDFNLAKHCPGAISSSLQLYADLSRSPTDLGNIVVWPQTSTKG